MPRSALFRKGTDRVRLVALLVLLSTIPACRKPETKPQHDVLTVLMRMPGASQAMDQAIMRQFTSETGTAIRLIPGSESTTEGLRQETGLLSDPASGVDVLQIDIVWLGRMAKYLLNLKESLAQPLAEDLPDAVASATLGGRVVAAPFFLEYGMLYYRTDLLNRYGFRSPPRTWDELEMQASRIQKGERMRGHADFWGYVWQGADYEGLTCNALEWQSSQGGGNLLTQERVVNVDNPAAIRAFSRAKRWVGTISSRSVLGYNEEDSRNVFESGRALFLRNWSYVYRLAKSSPFISDRFSVAPMPAGVDPHSSVLGGWYLGISKYSKHPDEAVAFIKFMMRRNVQRERAAKGGFLPAIAALYRDSVVSRANPFFSWMSNLSSRMVSRPALLAGDKYDAVSRAYAHGVHNILVGQVSPADGAASIQAEITHLGFPNRTPRPPGSANREHQ